MKPVKTIWDCGRDKYGRRVLLHREGDTFQIESQPVSQRDEGERCASLTAQNILDMARAIAPPPHGDGGKEG